MGSMIEWHRPGICDVLWAGQERETLCGNPGQFLVTLGCEHEHMTVAECCSGCLETLKQYPFACDDCKHDGRCRSGILSTQSVVTTGG